MPDTKSEQRNPPGPIGLNVIANVEQLRQERGLSYDAMAAEMAKIGHQLNQTSLSRLGRGERRVGADDLVALAIVLKVNPSTLLLPRDADANDLIELTPRVSQRAWVAWSWADGALPLPMDTVGENADVETTTSDAADFVRNARPRFRQSDIHVAVRAIHGLLGRVIRLIGDYGNPVTYDYREDHIRRALKRVELETDDLLDGSNREAQRRSLAEAEQAPKDGRRPEPGWEQRDLEGLDPHNPFRAPGAGG